ncbi:MAG: hypothetical protein H8E47_08570 [Anaerolineales bacterium]|nr:hypothetical protein [Anaerolineales bacterium]
MADAPSRARLIGVIILARFLKLPLTRYEAVIEKVKGSPMFTQLWPDVISVNLFPRAQEPESPTCWGLSRRTPNKLGIPTLWPREIPNSQALESARPPPPNAIGLLREDQLGFYVSYRHAGLAREYVIDEGKMSHWRQGHMLSASDEAEIQTLRRQLRLINTRNRLTHVILMGIAEHQAAYLASGDALRLRPLSQVALAEWIRREAQGDNRFLPPGSKLEFVDHSMISRLTRGISVLSPQGQDIPLRDFFPSTRDVHKRLIEAILDEEKEQIRRGDIERAYTDEEIKERLKERFGVSISRRTVTACRQDMRTPSSYTRNSNRTYPPKLAHFSFHYPLNVASVKANAPEVSGVYEISLAEVEVDYPLCSSGVVYIGHAKNLRKRLRDHLGPNSKNGDLTTLLRHRRAVFRYIVKQRGIRAEEKVLCQCFISAHGSLPRCNRIRP